jgi:glycosyltransferase involved in cell wall biosynthesis
MKKVSAVIITYNEAAVIRKTLGQLWWCDEIVIVDSFSSDNTVGICRQYGCKIHQRVFNGYGDQKRFALKQASNDWVLFIDADEVLSNPLVDEILELTRIPDSCDGYEIPMNLVFRGYEFRHGKESNCYFPRLFNRKKSYITNDKVHEQIVIKGKVKQLQHHILHYSYNSTHHYFSKFNRYTTYGAEQSYLKDKKRSTLLIIFSVPLYFLKYYFLERNFLNGINGFYWSMFSASSHFVKYIKLQDLRHLPTDSLLESWETLQARNQELSSTLVNGKNSSPLLFRKKIDRKLND